MQPDPDIVSTAMSAKGIHVQFFTKMFKMRRSHVSGISERERPRDNKNELLASRRAQAAIWVCLLESGKGIKNDTSSCPHLSMRQLRIPRVVCRTRIRSRTVSLVATVPNHRAAQRGVEDHSLEWTNSNVLLVGYTRFCVSKNPRDIPDGLDSALGRRGLHVASRMNSPATSVLESRQLP